MFDGLGMHSVDEKDGQNTDKKTEKKTEEQVEKKQKRALIALHSNPLPSSPPPDPLLLLAQQQQREKELREWKKREEEAREEWERKEELKREEEQRRAELEERRKEAGLERNRHLLSLPLSPSSPSPSSPFLPKANSLCSFFIKTGACTFADRCSKSHPPVSLSRTLLMKNMFDGLGMHSVDDLELLEHDDHAIHSQFLEFYHDVKSEFEKYGRVQQLKVCKNQCGHLRGNVYVQYRTQEESKKAYEGMRGRYYGGKRVEARYVEIEEW
eukprot:CAMPEP_0174276296 /NCGR_PEP_ID=MMETSP0439-20130205/60236_1 /TAXON_ID=0 /ORGANISM="Stereomyxa ramosa, Strain Chinc5" /LENGTH=268 /DNA_ID=CAMNT_0015368499 /DNA_START=407 /DNA_END=1211 /DNA_ORIENTATION=+